MHKYLKKSQISDELIDSLIMIKDMSLAERENILDSLDDDFWLYIDKVRASLTQSLDHYISAENKRTVANTLAVFFETDFRYQDFVENIFLPISSNLKKYLADATFHILKYDRFVYKQRGTLLLYKFKSQKNQKESSTIIKKYLFDKVTEFQLDKIHILSKAECLIYHNTFKSVNVFNLYSEISNQLTYFNSEEILSDNMRLTYFIYFYILAGLYYYPNIEEFVKKNEIVYKHFLTGSSTTSSTLFDSIKYEDLEKKLEREYSSIYYSLHDEIKDNYHDLLIGDASKTTSFNYLTELQGIYSSIESDKDLFFIKFIDKSFDFFFIDKYYKGLIPYIIKKYTNEIF